MAVKKQKKNSGINLLKGITGSKLAKLIAILFILAAVPFTVLMSQKQQNTEQEASIGIGGGINIGITMCGLRNPAGGKCITDRSPNYPNCNASGGVVVANCSTSTFCCVPSGGNSCRVNNYGHCQYTNEACKSGVWVSNANHNCPGPANYKCCKK